MRKATLGSPLVLALTALAGCPGDDPTPVDGTSGGPETSTAPASNSGTSPGTDPSVMGSSSGETTMSIDIDTTTGGEESSSGGTTMVVFTGSTTDGPGSEDSTTGIDYMGECPDEDIGSDVPASISDTTVGADNTLFGSCGGHTAGDNVYLFTAPENGLYSFDTENSDYNTVLYLLEDCEEQEQMDCDDDGGPGATSRIDIDLTADQTVVVVVDGEDGEEGNYELNIELDICPDEELDNDLPTAVAGDTSGQMNTSTGSCVGDMANDYAYSFTAPFDGTFIFDTVGSDYDTGLYALDSTTCSGVEIACNDDTFGLQSEIQVDLLEDDVITVVVDGYNSNSGAFNLNVRSPGCGDGIIDAPEVCDGADLDGMDCDDFGLIDGVLACDDTCNFDTDACLPPVCGDGVITGVEECDGVDLAGMDCGDFDLIDGVLACDAVTCAFDTSACIAPICGNDLIEIGEDCDGMDLDGEDCVSRGFPSGDLGCDAVTCAFDESSCDTCGDSIVNGVDVCDGQALNATRCEDLGYEGGTLDCTDDDCSLFDESECADGIVVVCANPAAAITDNSTTSSTIMIPDMGDIADVDVFVDITHTYVGDLEMTLNADDLGLSNALAADDCFSPNDVWAFFNDEGNDELGNDCIEPYGLEGNLVPMAALSVYDDSEVNGSWTLDVFDDAGGDSGTLNEWCLYITLAP